MGTAKVVLEKLDGLDAPKVLAVVDAFPGKRQGLDAVLRGEKKIILEDTVPLLFDKNGRCIPHKLAVSAAVCDPNRGCRFNQFNFGLFNGDCLLPDWQKYFGQTPIYGSELLSRILAIRAKVFDDPTVANLLSGPWFPILLPGIQLGEGGYGALLENFILPAAAKGHTEAFPERQFIN